MPSGYTSDIYNGKEMSGKEFIMNCARAFGACITMRDDSMDTPIPEEFKPDTYHLKRIENVKIELKKYQAMTPEEIQNEIEIEYKNSINYNQERTKEYTSMRNRYLNTLAEVTQWQPPTSEHINLKEFAIKQIKDSMNWDCNLSYYEKEVIKPTPKEWLQVKIDSCLRDIDYHSKENEAEIKRVAERNKWVKDLRDSLECL